MIFTEYGVTAIISFVLCPLPFVPCLLSSLLCPQSSVLCSPRIVLCPLSTLKKVFIHPCLFLYFGSDRWGFIHFETIRGLIVYYGISIFASSLAMTVQVQVTKDNGIFDLNAIDNIYKRRFLRVVLFLLSPMTSGVQYAKSL